MGLPRPSKASIKAYLHEPHSTRVAATDGCIAASEIGFFYFFAPTLLQQLHASNAARVNQPLVNF